MKKDKHLTKEVTTLENNHFQQSDVYNYDDAEQMDIFMFLNKESETLDTSEVEINNDKTTSETDSVLSDEEIEMLVEKHQNLVYMIAHQFSNQSNIEFEELVQIGMVGLFEATKRFRPEYNYKFSTYAVTYVRGVLLSALKEHNNGASYTLRAKVFRNKVIQSGVDLNTLTVEKIRELFPNESIPDMLAHEILDAIKNRSIVALDAPNKTNNDEAGGTTILDTVGVEVEMNEKLINNELLKRVFALLDERERKFVILQAEGYTQAEISEIYDIHQSTVSRVFRQIDLKVAPLKEEYLAMA